MDYSVHAYLERRSSLELIVFLQSCAQRNLWNEYVDSVPLVFAVLQKRSCPIPQEISASWEAYLTEIQNT